jgi:hypothetical protein
VIAEIAKFVRNAQCNLFLGAGVHAPPPAQSRFSYPDGARPPFGGELAAFLATGCSFQTAFPGESDRNLQRVALQYELANTRFALVSAVRTQVQEGRSPSPALRALAELPFRLIITTNYDQLFERALRDARKEPAVVAYNPDSNAITPDLVPSPAVVPEIDQPHLLKIHGDVASPPSIVITDEDYITFILRMNDKQPCNPFSEGVRYLLQKWPTLFIGYSLMDYNLRLLFRTLRWKMDAANYPPSYAVDPHPDRLVSTILGERRAEVRFVVQDVWAFTPVLYELVKGSAMPTMSRPRGVSSK